MSKNYRFCFKFPKNRGQFLVFGLPQSNHYQQIFNLKISPPASKMIENLKWGNKITVFRLNDVKKNVLIQFKQRPHLIDKTITKDWQTIDYQTLLSKFSYFLKPNLFINGQDPQVIKLTKNTIGKETNLYRIIKKLYDFNLDYLTYGKPTEGLYSYKQAMGERTTDCGGFSTLLASLLQSLKIPSRLTVGFLIKRGLFKEYFSMLHVACYMFHDLIMHTWLEVLLPNGFWFPLDPSIEWRRAHGTTTKKGGFGYIPPDRLVISYGCDFKIPIDNKNYRIDLLQNVIYV